MKPNATNEERKHLLAMQDAAYLEDMQGYEIAEFLEKFEGYPLDDERLEACERESLITNDGDQAAGVNFIVYLDKGESGEFKYEDDAYAFLCENYQRVVRRVLWNE